MTATVAPAPPTSPSIGPAAPPGSQPATAPHVATNVAQAVIDLGMNFGADRVRAWADGTGGAQVVIDDVPLSSTWTTTSTWVGFALSHLVPEADTYPHYVRADLGYADGRPLTVPLSPATFAGVPAVQVSRRQRPGTAARTPAAKTRGVLAWLRSPE
ncbi:MAG: hypothetical protein JWM31_687 [Solirubrobacterales bacterium]|nr:hypothetical protein [Solirubrobacterales bacterium]